MARFANEAPLHAGSRPKRRLGVGARDVAGTVIRRRDPFKQEELTPQIFQIGIAGLRPEELTARSAPHSLSALKRSRSTSAVDTGN